MKFQNLHLEIRGQILFLTISRESKLNALNKETLKELHHALADAFKDPTVKGILITGAGKKAFVAGADIAELQALTSSEAENMARTAQQEVFDFIHYASKPVIAAINGFALGGGLELALACHIRIGCESSKMGLPEVSLGLIPGYGGTQRLAQLVGKGKAFEMILTGDMITAVEAHRIGLLNGVVADDVLLIKAEDILKRILQRSPVAIKTAIKTINAGYEIGINGFDVEIENFGKCFDTEDFKIGTQAFLNKIKPAFTGR